jgi:hypothetical protein
MQLELPSLTFFSLYLLFSSSARYQMAAASLGNKGLLVLYLSFFFFSLTLFVFVGFSPAFFAGGFLQSSVSSNVIDIYDLSKPSNPWSVQYLSVARRCCLSVSLFSVYLSLISESHLPFFFCRNMAVAVNGPFIYFAGGTRLRRRRSLFCLRLFSFPFS